MNTPEEIGDYIEQLRKSKGLTQSDMAEKLGIKTSTYTHFETGRTNMTSAILFKVANVMFVLPVSK